MVLTECTKKLNDYDLQMLLADNYKRKGDLKKALEKYRYAANMIPCRFLPLYKQLEVLILLDKNAEATQIAKKIEDKEVKVESFLVREIVDRAKDYLQTTN